MNLLKRYWNWPGFCWLNWQATVVILFVVYCAVVFLADGWTEVAWNIPIGLSMLYAQVQASEWRQYYRVKKSWDNEGTIPNSDGEPL